MNLIKPIKNKTNATISTLIFLMIICCVSFFLIVIMSCLLGRLIVYINTGILIFNWEKDIFYSLRIGISAGVLTAIGVWIKTKLLERKVKKTLSE